MKFIDDGFMLRGETARRLFFDYAADQPIIDYHCHLDPGMIAEDYRFSSITELMLGGDHYKWRAMRSFGIEERYITGDADDLEKFRAYAEIMPWCIGNPLYHWTHLELLRYFGIDECLTPANAVEIFTECGRRLGEPEFTARGLIEKSRVELLCTTDDPADDLRQHKKIAEDGFSVRVLPAFRPDRLLNIHKDSFQPYIKEAGITSFEGLLYWISERIDFFHENGCRISDHGLEEIPFAEGNAARVFEAALRSERLNDGDVMIYRTALLRFLAREYSNRGWCMQLHFGALRDNNKRMYRQLGPDTGFDSVGDDGVARPLSRLLDSMDADGALPRTILYSLNPKDNCTITALTGCFQSPPHRSKVQLGSAWWFNDTRDGMEEQLRTFASMGILGSFVGMLTDSRSFISYTRHEYFRRILCSLLGGWVDAGEYPADFNMLGQIVRALSYGNAKRYFNF